MLTTLTTIAISTATPKGMPTATPAPSYGVGSCPQHAITFFNNWNSNFSNNDTASEVADNANVTSDFSDEIEDGGLYCPMVFDSYLCWPRTRAGEKVWQRCPEGVPGLDEEKSVFRQCLEDGTWFSCPLINEDGSLMEAEAGVNATSNPENLVGWTNYSLCWTASTQKIMADLNQKPECPSGDSGAKIKIFVAQMSRVLEMVGYSMSFIVLVFALATFCYFRKLRKPRVTRIHMNLFASMILQSLVRLVIYVDQIVVRYKTADNAAASASEPEVASNNGTSGGGGSSSSSSSSTSDGVWGIDNTPLLCETFYTLIEYGKTTMFLWMFIEGIILYHMTTVAYSRGPEHQTLFYLCGWFLPVPLTIAWLITKSYEAEADSSHCGIGYSLLPSYWILEGPRIAAIMLNILILLNVMRVLFTHLSGNESSDTKQIRKSLKSLLFLLPLLGITNVLHFVWPNPLRGSWQSFAVWSITSHFLYSFQGVFVASVYFLFDDKVKDTLYKFWVLKVRLREWGTDKDRFGSNSRPGSIVCNNRIFEPNGGNPAHTTMTSKATSTRGKNMTKNFILINHGSNLNLYTETIMALRRGHDNDTNTLAVDGDHHPVSSDSATQGSNICHKSTNVIELTSATSKSRGKKKPTLRRVKIPRSASEQRRNSETFTPDVTTSNFIARFMKPRKSTSTSPNQPQPPDLLEQHLPHVEVLDNDNDNSTPFRTTTKIHVAIEQQQIGNNKSMTRDLHSCNATLNNKEDNISKVTVVVDLEPGNNVSSVNPGCKPGRGAIV